jgi:CYTH domain-containing protein
MSVVRRFLVAPALVRLIRKERGGSRITEGYFAPQAGRTSFVRVDGQQCHLVLVTTSADGSASEERTDVPRAHGDALLDVCSGKAAYDRTNLSVSGRDVMIDRYVSPGSLDLVSITFDNETDANAFVAPIWFGREVSSDSAYERHAVALQGPPQAGEISLNNAALDAVLDLIEPRFGFGRYGASSKGSEGGPSVGKSGEDDGGVVNALRRIAGNGSAAVAAPAAAAVAVATPVEARTPEPEPEAQPEPARAEAGEAHHAEHAEAAPTDARIDDVIESLSQALGAAIQQPHEPAQDQAREDDPASAFERWTVRPRRSQQ